MITELDKLALDDCAFINGDCMEGLKRLPDKCIDLAIVDPPYGSGGANGQALNGSAGGSTSTAIPRGGGTESRSTNSVHFQRKNCRQPDGTWGYANWRNVGGEVCKKIIAWDTAPGKEYFAELFRVSRNQIIWGGNYFELPPTRCFLIWRKLTISEKFSMAMCEYAWTSFNDNAKMFEHVPQDNTGARFHPTQKPVALYEWCISRYAKEGDIILDTHVGSASSLIACHRTRHRFIGFELDEDYYRMAMKRLTDEMNQMTIFDFDI